MPDKKKIIMMTELARHEKAQGKREFIVNSYFAVDYIGRFALGGFLSYSVCFILVLVLMALYRFSEISNEPDISKILDIFRPYIGYYIIGLVIYELLIIVIRGIIFSKGRRGIRETSVMLRKLLRYGEKN